MVYFLKKKNHLLFHSFVSKFLCILFTCSRKQLISNFYLEGIDLVSLPIGGGAKMVVISNMERSDTVAEFNADVSRFLNIKLLK